MTEPSVFIAEYLRVRGITGAQDSEIGREVRSRAEEARERFKRLRAAPNEPSVDEDTLTKEQKYNRRLANNRKSAAASRVYAEVLRRETEHALKQTSEKSRQYQAELDKMEAKLDEERALNTELKERLVQLEAAARDPPSPTSVSELEKRDATATDSASTTVATPVTPATPAPQQPLPTLEPSVSAPLMFSLSTQDDMSNLFRFSQDTNWRASQELRLIRSSQERATTTTTTKDDDVVPRPSQEAYEGLVPLSSQELGTCERGGVEGPSTRMKMSSPDLGQVDNAMSSEPNAIE